MAATYLEGKGFQHFLPVYRCRRRWTDRVVEYKKPLFPGYLFCRFDASRSLPVRTTPGVVSVLGFGNEPAPISDREMEAVQAIVESGLGAEPYPFLREGQRVRITRGPLEDVEGILLQKKSEWRMVVSVELLQRSIAVEVDPETVRSL